MNATHLKLNQIPAPGATQSTVAVISLVVLLSIFPLRVSAHCDGLDGPVVKAAQRALTESNVNLVLIWVQKEDGPEIKRAFERTLAVRKLSNEAKDLADLYFFETIVRIHRTGEGAPYTGLKPAGRDLGPAIPAADKALRDGDVEPVTRLLTQAVQDGVRGHFKQALVRKNFDVSNVEAGREFVKAYVKYIHCVEALHEQATRPVHGHFEETKPPAHHEER